MARPKRHDGEGKTSLSKLDAPLHVAHERRLRIVESGREEDVRIRSDEPKSEAEQRGEARLDEEVVRVPAGTTRERRVNRVISDLDRRSERQEGVARARRVARQGSTRANQWWAPCIVIPAWAPVNTCTLGLPGGAIATSCPQDPAEQVVAEPPVRVVTAAGIEVM